MMPEKHPGESDMMKWMRQQNDVVTLLAGMGTVFAGYVAWGFLTIFHKRGSCGWAGFFFSLLTMCLYALFCYSVVLLKKRDMSRQIWVICGWGSALSLLLLFRCGGTLFLREEYAKIGLNVLWLVDFVGCGFCIGNRMRNTAVRIDSQASGISRFASKIYMVWSQGKWLCVLLMVTFLFLIEPDAKQFKWDGLLYYQACQNGVMDSISSLAPYGHIAQTYGMFNCLGRLLMGDMATAMIVINIILYMCSIGAFYGMIKCMLPGRRDFIYALTTAVYAWSPYTLGMVFYHSLDFYCQCFFVIMLYFLYRRQWIYFFTVSLLFCFTKEPAILIYGTMCAGIVIVDFVDQTGIPFGMRFWKLVRRKQYYFMILPGILWLVTYKILGPWSSGAGEFSIDTAYVLEKLKVLYLFQFNWVFMCACVGGLMVCMAGKRKKELRCLFPVLCGQIAFTIFSCVFSTVNHPRYNGANQPALYCMAILFTVGFLEHLYGRIVVAGAAVLMVVSSFYTIDPVTLLCFPEYHVGNTVMVTTSANPLGDGMIYNRQMLWLEHALGMALEDALKESDVVFFPAVGDSTYYFDGMAEVEDVDEGGRWGQEYWNAGTDRRATAPGEGVENFYVYHLPENMDWDGISERIKGRYNYCYLPCAGEQQANKIRESFRVLEEKTYQYRGWSIHRICFE